MTHIMVDLETWGTTPGSDIRSIGAVVFDPIAGTLGDEFYVATFNPPIFVGEPVGDGSDYLYPLTRDPSTEQWWLEQSAEARAAFDKPVELQDALLQFIGWWAGHEIDADYARFWAHGPHFDEQILAACYRAVVRDVPWHYRAPRDLRTILEAAGMDAKADIPNFGTAHNALDDAKAQALGVIEAFRRIRETRPGRVAELLEANNREVERRRDATTLLREAAERFRFYEGSHRAKVREIPERAHPEIVLGYGAINDAANKKADRNAEIAGRIEAFLNGPSA